MVSAAGEALCDTQVDAARIVEYEHLFSWIIKRRRRTRNFRLDLALWMKMAKMGPSRKRNKSCRSGRDESIGTADSKTQNAWTGQSAQTVARG
jgi:hypothetical protein